LVRYLRVLLLGAVAIGIVLALTSAPSSSGPLGQVTGYGDSVLKPCPPGQDTAFDGGPCLNDLEVASGEAAGSQDEGDDGGLGGMTWVLIGVGVVLVGGGAAYGYGRLRP
jgi:hypothetical protein